jgi:hypothetical protein
MTSRNQSGVDPDTESTAWLWYRRVVGTPRLFVQAGVPWRLLFRERVAGLVSDLTETVTGWEGVSPAPHRYGGVEFRFEGRELGHIHDWGLVDLPLARPLRDAVVECSLAHPHHVLPDSGWVSTFLATDGDLDRVVTLFELAHIWTRQTVTGDAHQPRVASLSAPTAVRESLREHGRTVSGTG